MGRLSPSAVTASTEPVRCSVGTRVPGFQVTDSHAVPEPDRVGLSVRMRDPAGHKLVFTAGVPGDFAEGATSLGQVSVMGGLEGQIYGAGSVWVLTWNEGGPCGLHSAIGNDVSKRGFIVAMTNAGVMQPGD